MNRNQRLSWARSWAHGIQCMSEGCRDGGDNDHARRTQMPFARAFIDAVDNSQRIDALHRLLCVAATRGTCTDQHHTEHIGTRIMPTLEVPS